MRARTRMLLGAASFAAFATTACSDAVTSPTAALHPTSLRASGGSTSGGGGGTSGGGGGGGGSTATIPQVAGTWTGQEHYDPSLSVFFLPAFMNPSISMTLSEDASGNITGIDNIMHVSMTGKASGNGTIVLQDGVYYGQKVTVSVTGSVTCSDGSTGTVLSGKFQRKEGFGTISVDNCPTT